MSLEPFDLLNVRTPDWRIEASTTRIQEERAFSREDLSDLRDRGKALMSLLLAEDSDESTSRLRPRAHPTAGITTPFEVDCSLTRLAGE
jgi:hypothetical protein